MIKQVKRTYQKFSIFVCGLRFGSVALTLCVGIGLFFFPLLSLRAEQVTPRQALRIAREYVTLPKNISTRATKGKGGKNAVTPYYIFNDVQGKGFVIVSGDGDMGEVLAYSREGKLDTLHANPGVKLLLAGYTRSFRQLQRLQHVSGERAKTPRYSKTVVPLLASRWSQAEPYNGMTGYPYTGCVATAVAQVMYYHRWPETGKGKVEYTVTYDRRKKSADFSRSHYAWADMLPAYASFGGATQVQKDAVAKLMSDVGIAVRMQYTPRASGTQSRLAYQALKDNFDYSVAFISKLNEGAANFTAILRSELLNSYPVYLSGSGKGGGSGHAWVADGFDENGLFHMNFGWGGQSDGYYSLTALNVSQSGSEFGGRPLAFSYGIEAIVAHPNKPGSIPVDKALLEDSPQLSFNGEGYLVLPSSEEKMLPRTRTMAVAMSHFVNKGKNFKGDIGIGIYDSAGERVAICPSDDHASGGFTNRHFAQYEDKSLISDGLINTPQTINVPLKGLANGYYRLVPMCVALLPDGKWDEWVKMKNAPTMEIELTNANIRIAELNKQEAGFQLMGEPVVDGQLVPGGKTTVVLPLKNLSGVPRDGYVKMLLLGKDGKVACVGRTQKAVEFDGFSANDVSVPLTLGEDIAPGHYEVRLEVIGDDGQGGLEDGQTVRYRVGKLHDKESAFVEILPLSASSWLKNQEIVFYDDGRDAISREEIDLGRYSLLGVMARLKTTLGKTYQGTVSIFLQDMTTRQMLKLTKSPKQVTVVPGAVVEVNSGWLKNTDLPVVNGRRYRVVLYGNSDGKDFEISNSGIPVYYVTFKGSKHVPDNGGATGIESADGGGEELAVTHGNKVIEVRGGSLLALRLFDVNGRLVRQVSVAGRSEAAIFLQGLSGGVYILRIEARGRHTAHRFVYGG